MSDSRFTRRGFMEQAGALGSVPLIGTLMAAGPFQAKAVPQLKGKAKSITIPTHEFAGPNGAPWIEEVLSFARKYPNFYIDTSAYAVHRLPQPLIDFMCGDGAAA